MRALYHNVHVLRRFHVTHVVWALGCECDALRVFGDFEVEHHLVCSASRDTQY